MFNPQMLLSQRSNQNSWAIKLENWKTEIKMIHSYKNMLQQKQLYPAYIIL